MTVTQKFVGDTTQLMREYDKILAKQTKMEQDMRRMAEESKRENKNQQVGLGSVAKSVLSVAASYISVQTAISGTKAVLDDYMRQQRESAELAKRLAQSQSDAIKNMAGMATAAKAGLIDDISDISLRTGFADVGKLTEAAGSAISSGATPEMARKAIEAAAQVTVNRPEQLATYAAGAVNIGRATGTVDSERNLGFLLQAGAQAQVVDPEMLARNLAPVVASQAMRAAPADKETVARESAAIFATLSRAGTDVTGQSTTTAATQFMSRMDSFFSEMENAPKTPFAQLGALSTDAELQAKFFSESFGEERFKAAFKDIGTGGSLYRDALAAKESIQFSAEEFAQQAAESRAATGELFVASSAGQMSAVNENLKQDFQKAFAETLREQVKENLSLTRGSGAEYVANYMDEYGAGLPIVGAGSPQEAIAAAKRAVQNRLFDLQANRQEYNQMTGNNLPVSQSETGSMAMLKVLENIEKELKTQNYSNEALKRFLESQQGNPQPYGQRRAQEGTDQ